MIFDFSCHESLKKLNLNFKSFHSGTIFNCYIGFNNTDVQNILSFCLVLRSLFKNNIIEIFIEGSYIFSSPNLNSEIVKILTKQNIEIKFNSCINVDQINGYNNVLINNKIVSSTNVLILGPSMKNNDLLENCKIDLNMFSTITGQHQQLTNIFALGTVLEPNLDLISKNKLVKNLKSALTLQIEKDWDIKSSREATIDENLIKSTMIFDSFNNYQRFCLNGEELKINVTKSQRFKFLNLDMLLYFHFLKNRLAQNRIFN